MRKNVGQKSVDMGLRPDKNMGGWVGFFFFGPHTPVTFLDKYPPRVSELKKLIDGNTNELI